MRNNFPRQLNFRVSAFRWWVVTPNICRLGTSMETAIAGNDGAFMLVFAAHLELVITTLEVEIESLVCAECFCFLFVCFGGCVHWLIHFLLVSRSRQGGHWLAKHCLALRPEVLRLYVDRCRHRRRIEPWGCSNQSGVSFVLRRRHSALSVNNVTNNVGTRILRTNPKPFDSVAANVPRSRRERSRVCFGGCVHWLIL